MNFDCHYTIVPECAHREISRVVKFDQKQRVLHTYPFGDQEYARPKSTRRRRDLLSKASMVKSGGTFDFGSRGTCLSYTSDQHLVGEQCWQHISLRV